MIMRAPGLVFAAITILFGTTMTARGSQDPPLGILEEVTIDQKLDAQVPLDLVFTDSTGRRVRLADSFGSKPVILNLAYYECPMLCTLVMNGMVRAMRAIDLELGADYEVLTVSIDPGETPELAAPKRRTYLGFLGDPESTHWSFLTGSAGSIDRLTDSVGFRYTRDEATGQWAHASAIMVLTPDGHVSRYLYGIEYAPRDLQLALVEAAGGMIGSPIDELLLYCFHYDPTTGRYGLAIMNVVRVLGLLTLAGLAGFVGRALRRERGAVNDFPTGKVG
jgi:protein SCO1/2